MIVISNSVLHNFQESISATCDNGESRDIAFTVGEAIMHTEDALPLEINQFLHWVFSPHVFPSKRNKYCDCFEGPIPGKRYCPGIVKARVCIVSLREIVREYPADIYFERGDLIGVGDLSDVSAETLAFDLFDVFYRNRASGLVMRIRSISRAPLLMRMMNLHSMRQGLSKEA